MSGRAQFKQPQGPIGHFEDREEHERLQDAVRLASGVVVTIVCKSNEISVRAKDYTDFIMAKSVIKQRSGLPIVWENKI
jgi:hypothetical protein